MLLNGSISESQDVNVAEIAKALPPHGIHCAAIQFGLSADSVIFDDNFSKSEPLIDECESEMQSVVSQNMLTIKGKANL